MFVSRQRDRLSLIRQDVHMRQTADLASQWTLDSFPAPESRERLAAAMAIHDNGWIPLDDDIRYDPDARGPLNFTSVALPEHVDLYRTAYDEAVAEDPATGLLIGMHWIGLYTMRYGLEPGSPYETDGPAEERLRDETVETIEKSWVDLKRRLWAPVEQRSEFEDRVWRQYEVSQYVDRLSIIMATRDMAEAGEWSVGRVRLHTRGGSDEWVEPIVRSTGDGTLTLDPFPFEEDVATSLTRRWIDDRDYASHDELRDAVESSAPETLDLRLVAR